MPGRRECFAGEEDGMHGESSNTKSFFCSLMKRKENIIRDSETPLKMGDLYNISFKESATIAAPFFQGLIANL